MGRNGSKFVTPIKGIDRSVLDGRALPSPKSNMRIIQRSTDPSALPEVMQQFKSRNMNASNDNNTAHNLKKMMALTVQEEAIVKKLRSLK